MEIGRRMEMNKLVYLAGPISGCSQEQILGWRALAEETLSDYGIRTLCPIDVKSNWDAIGEAAILRDKIDVQRCDIVLMNLLGASYVSIGTMVELGWADAYGKPVVLVMEPGNVHTHGFVRSLARFKCSSLAEAFETIKTILQ